MAHVVLYHQFGFCPVYQKYIVWGAIISICKLVAPYILILVHFDQEVFVMSQIFVDLDLSPRTN